MKLGVTGVRLAGVKIEIRGLENLQPSRNYIFMSNHVSNLDPPVFIPSIPGRCSVLIKKEVFRLPIFGKALRMAEMVPVDRSNREAAIESMFHVDFGTAAGFFHVFGGLSANGLPQRHVYYQPVAKKCVHAMPGAIDELIRNYEIQRLVFLLE